MRWYFVTLILLSACTQVIETVSLGGEVSVHYIDVGQGDSTLIILPNNQTVLIDCGKTNNGQDIITYLTDIGVDDIDLLIATHPDTDHIGGCDEIIQGFAVQTILTNGQTKNTRTYRDFIAAAQQRDLQILTKDSVVTLDPSANLTLLVSYGAGYDENSNENSIVAKLEYGAKFLFTGDCESKCESVLEETDVDIYKVGHHGSKTSSNSKFLSEITPEIAIISAGKDNKYRHPHPSAIKRISKHTDNIFGTYDHGTIVVKTDGAIIEVFDSELLLWKKV